MRIGRVIIDTDNMTVEELGILIRELKAIKSRKQKAVDLLAQLKDTIEHAEAEGFTFLDTDFGTIIRTADVGIRDMKGESTNVD